MPLIPVDYISNLYIAVIKNLSPFENKILIIDSFTQKNTQSVQEQKVLQASLGTKIMSIGGWYYQTSIGGAILLNADGFNVSRFSNNTITTPFELFLELLYNTYDLQKYKKYVPFSIGSAHTAGVLTKANISFGDTIKCDLSFNHNEANLIELVQKDDPQIPPKDALFDKAIRVARWYDTELKVTDKNNNDIFFYIIDGNINFSIETEEKYFINSFTQSPWFGIRGIKVDGSINIMIHPNSIPFIKTQIPGKFEFDNFARIRYLKIQSNNLPIENTLDFDIINKKQEFKGAGYIVINDKTNNVKSNSIGNASISFSMYI